jgi:hypothetical protein
VHSIYLITASNLSSVASASTSYDIYNKILKF